MAVVKMIEDFLELRRREAAKLAEALDAAKGALAAAEGIETDLLKLSPTPEVFGLVGGLRRRAAATLLWCEPGQEQLGESAEKDAQYVLNAIRQAESQE